MMVFRFCLNQPCLRRGATIDREGKAPRCSASSVMTTSALGTEDAEQQNHHEHHRDRADHADGRGEALSPQSELKCLIVHEDGPGIGRRGAVKAAEDKIL